VSRHRLLALVLVLLGGLWLVINGPLEGPVLWELDATHGLTAADLLSVLAFGLAGWLWLGKAQASRPDD
jgi:hypothetical protein